MARLQSWLWRLREVLWAVQGGGTAVCAPVPCLHRRATPGSPCTKGGLQVEGTARCHGLDPESAQHKRRGCSFQAREFGDLRLNIGYGW